MALVEVCCYGIDLGASIVSFHQSEDSIWRDLDQWERTTLPPHEKQTRSTIISGQNSGLAWQQHQPSCKWRAVRPYRSQTSPRAVCHGATPSRWGQMIWREERGVGSEYPSDKHGQRQHWSFIDYLTGCSAFTCSHLQTVICQQSLTEFSKTARFSLYSPSVASLLPYFSTVLKLWTK